MTDLSTRVEYGEFDDALSWIIEAPSRDGQLIDVDGGTETAEQILEAAAKQLDVDGRDFGEFCAMGFLRVISGDYGLDTDVVKGLMGQETRLAILVGIAASRGKCPGP